MTSLLPIHCPACGSRIRAVLGCHPDVRIQAMQLQARRFGTELRCDECCTHHIVLRIPLSRESESAGVPSDTDRQSRPETRPDDQRQT